MQINLTNKITYNRLLRGVKKILDTHVFEFNDDYTRYSIYQKLRQLLNQAKTFAIKDYELTILDFDKARPHYVEVHIIIQFHNMIEHVHLNINNVDEL